MIDTKAVSNTIFREIKRRIYGKSKYGNESWDKANSEWYEQIHDSNYLLHEDFIKYFKKLIDLRVF